jgi:hypothetical protein
VGLLWAPDYGGHFTKFKRKFMPQGRNIVNAKVSLYDPADKNTLIESKLNQGIFSQLPA